MAAPADPVAGFYDALADDYHLIHRDWERSLHAQGEALDRLIAATLGPGRRRILDCSAGIGTQALGLAMRGHEVHAADISAASVDRLRHEAAARGLAVTAAIADMRALPDRIAGDFDVVLSCDNALAHMLAPGDLARAAAAMAAKTRPGGLVLVSVRDYDAILAERPAFVAPGLYDAPSEERIMFQLWRWQEDAPIYDVRLFLLIANGEDWRVHHYRTRLRAVTRAEVSAALGDAGLGEIAWHEADAVPFHQPVVTARRGGG